MTEGEEPIVSLLTDKDSACMFSCFQEKVVFFYPLQDHGVCVCVRAAKSRLQWFGVFLLFLLTLHLKGY